MILDKFCQISLCSVLIITVNMLSESRKDKIYTQSSDLGVSPFLPQGGYTESSKNYTGQYNNLQYNIASILIPEGWSAS